MFFLFYFIPRFQKILTMTGLNTKWVETIDGTSSVVTLGKTVDNSLQSLQNDNLIVIIPGRDETHIYLILI